MQGRPSQVVAVVDLDVGPDQPASNVGVAAIGGTDQARAVEGVLGVDICAVLERQVQALKNDLKGVIRLTCPEPTVSRIAATGLLDRFHQRYPGLAVEFITSDRYLDIANGEADVAFRSGEPTDDSLVGRKICDSVWAIYASKSYVQQHGRPGSVDELENHSLIGFDGIMQNHRVAKWLTQAVPNAHIVNRNNNFVSQVSYALFRLTEPVLGPIRRFMPDLGGIDISPVVALILLQFVRYLVIYYGVQLLR